MSQQLSRDQRTQAPSSSIETPATSLSIQPTQQSQARCTKNSNDLSGISNAEDITLCLTKSGDYYIGNSIANQMKLFVRGRTGVYHFELALYGEKGWNFHPAPHRAPFLKALRDFVMFYKRNPLPNISEKVHLRKLRIYSAPTSSQPVQSTQQSQAQAHDTALFAPGESPNNLFPTPPNHDILPPSMMTNNAAVVAALQGKSDNSKDKMLMEYNKDGCEDRLETYASLSDIENDTLMLLDNLAVSGSKRNVEIAGLSKDNDSNSNRPKNLFDHAMPSSSSRYAAMLQQYLRDRETRTPSVETPTASLPVRPTQPHDAAPFVPGESPNNLFPTPPNRDIVPPSMMTNNAAVVAALQGKSDNSKDKVSMEYTKEVNEGGHRLEKQPSHVGLSDIEKDTLKLFDKLVVSGNKRNVDHAMPSSSSRYAAMLQPYLRDRETRTPSVETPTTSLPVQPTQPHDAAPFVPGESPNNLYPPPNHDIVPPSMMTNNAAVVAALQGKSDNSKDKVSMEYTKEVNEGGHRLEKQPSHVGLSDIEKDTLKLFDNLIVSGSKRNVEIAGLSKDNDSNSKRPKYVFDHAMTSSSSRYAAMSQKYSRDRETRTPSVETPTTSLPVRPTQPYDATLFVQGESPNDLYPTPQSQTTSSPSVATTTTLPIQPTQQSQAQAHDAAPFVPSESPPPNHDIVPPSIKYITVGCMPQEKPVDRIVMTLMDTTRKLNELRFQCKKQTGRFSIAEEIATHLKEFGSYNVEDIKSGRAMLLVRGHSDVYYYELALLNGKGWTFYPRPPKCAYPFHKTIIEFVDFHKTTPLPDIPERLYLTDSVLPPVSTTRTTSEPYFVGIFNSSDKDDLRSKWMELLENRP